MILYFLHAQQTRLVYTRLSIFFFAIFKCDGITLGKIQIAIASSSVQLTNKFSLFVFCRLKREEGGGSIIIQAMPQPQQLQQHDLSMDGRPLDHDEKKMRRQIANSNERRRMQSINAGFQSLRQLLPHHEGEKLSKVSQPTFSLYKATNRPRPIPLRMRLENANAAITRTTKSTKLRLINLQFPCTQLAIYGIRLNQLPDSHTKLISS